MENLTSELRLDVKDEQQRGEGREGVQAGKVERTQQTGKNCFSKWCWGNWTSARKRKRLDSNFTSYAKTNSKQIKHLHLRAKTVKL